MVIISHFWCQTYLLALPPLSSSSHATALHNFFSMRKRGRFVEGELKYGEMYF